MRCNDAIIKELLPSYLEGRLADKEKERIALHLSSCEDCRTELALLRTMAEAPVPDPGEDFWAALPGTVHREVRRNQDREQERRGVPTGLWHLFRSFRWAGATAAVVLVALVAGYLMLQPASRRVAGKQLPDTGGIYVDVLASEQVRISELDSPEIKSLDSWARKELASLSLQEGITDMFLNAPEGAIDDRLADMSTQELEHLSSMLDTQNEEEGS